MKIAMLDESLINAMLSRRSLLGRSGGGLGVLFLVSEVTGIPIPLLRQIDRALAQGGGLMPVNQKLFIMISNADGIRPNDFNMHWDAQPQFRNLSWTEAERVQVVHSPTETRLFPPGIGNLAKYGGRMTVLLGVDTQNNGHGGGNINATTNTTATLGSVNSFHSIVGISSAMILPQVSFTGTSTVTNGASSGGVSPAAFVASLQTPEVLSGAVLGRMSEFRERFHAAVVKKLSPADQKVIDRYWQSNTAFKDSNEKAAVLFQQQPPADNFLGQMQMAKRVFNAGLTNAFHIDGTGGQGFAFDTHGGNGPQRQLAKTLSDTISQFLDEAATAGDIDKINIMITTAFGRNPTFNGNGGDDHLPSNGHVTLIGPDFRPGSFGKTSNTQATARGVVGWAVNANSGQVGSEPQPGGEFKSLRPANVLKSVAEAIGVNKAAVAVAFPNTDSLPFIKKG